MSDPIKKILLTGASGFIGKRFLEYNKTRYEILPVSLQKTKVEEVDLDGVEAILHMAGKAHQMQKIDDQIYFDINYTLTQKLASRAKTVGIQHFIFISTIKVYGDDYDSAHLKNDTPTKPDDAYGASKLKAESCLLEMASDDFNVAIIRPPLVYGPGVKGNMIRLLGLIQKPIPLPFGGIQNERTMVFLDNLIELMNAVIDQKASGVFLAGDEEPLSTSRLMELMQLKLNQKNTLFKLPAVFVSVLQKIKPELVKRLFFSLTVDTSQTNKHLNFSPPFSSEHGIEQMVKWYKEKHTNE